MRHGFRILQHLYVTKQQGTVIFQQFTQEETQLANPPAKKKKKESTSLIIKEMKMKCHFYILVK